MRKESSILWSSRFGRGLSSLAATVLLQSVFLDGPLKAAFEFLGRKYGSSVAIGFLLVYGVSVYSVVYFGVIPRLLGYVGGARPGTIMSSGTRPKIQELPGTVLALVKRAIRAYRERKSRSQLLSDILFLSDTLTEHRHFARRHRQAHSQLQRRHAKFVTGYKNAQSDLEVEQVKHNQILASLNQALGENTALESRTFALMDDLAATERLLRIERLECKELDGLLQAETSGRLELEGRLETETRERSEVEGRLHTETHERSELEALVNNAYMEVARTMGLRLDTDSMSPAEKLAKVLQQFQKQKTEADELQDALESVRFEVEVRDASIAELESETDVLFEAGKKKDAIIATLSVDKERLLRDKLHKAKAIKEFKAREDQLVQERIGLDVTIMQLGEQKAQLLAEVQNKDVVIAKLGGQNDGLRCSGEDKDQLITALKDSNQCLHESRDKFSAELTDEKLNNIAKDKTIDALKEQVRELKSTVTEKDETIVTLKHDVTDLQDSSAKLQDSNAKLQDSNAKLQDANATLQTSVTALQTSVNTLENSITALQASLDSLNFECLAKDKTIAALEDRVHGRNKGVLEKFEDIVTLRNDNAALQAFIDSLPGDIEFADLEVRAKDAVNVMLHAKIGGLQNNAAEKDKTISTLRNEITTLQTSIDAFQDSMEFASLEGSAKSEAIIVLKNEITTLKASVNASQGSIDCANAEVLKKSRRIAWLNAECRDKEARIAGLQDRLNTSRQVSRLWREEQEKMVTVLKANGLQCRCVEIALCNGTTQGAISTGQRTLDNAYAIGNRWSPEQRTLDDSVASEHTFLLNNFSSGHNYAELGEATRTMRRRYDEDARKPLLNRSLEQGDGRVSGSRHAGTVVSLARDIVRRDGVLGLWRGTTATLLRNVPGVAFYFAGMNQVRTMLARTTYFAAESERTRSGSVLPKLNKQGNLLAGAFTRVTVGALLNPFTVLKARYEVRHHI
ncbi:hypothetical protein EVJ58_g1410 [Rhodofomes roseus]|uniref:Uncharacterized protein n=1 Tax=Rhodofomes roseus TaxID=34475 RepID=A0A4Y9YYT5_9APHY|nr:hypothetical protein EVJ58_g1410 [Rhodofomes roseus]